MSVCSETSQITSGSTSSGISRDSKSVSNRSQIHWKTFRKDVLAPHHIRILETSPGVRLPETIIGWVNANRDNVSRFTRQRKYFRKQVASGRGFGDSALFPFEVLPWTRGQRFIAKCMVPTYPSEPLPERRVRDDTGHLGLNPPEPSFACGFSSSAFGPEELRSIPNFLATSGTTLQFDTGSITPDSALYCPFITFERTFNQQKYGLEIAANQCAVDGAWCIRSLQMLHEKARGSSTPTKGFQDPVSFTCAIDNNVAIMNYHWVDHAKTFCMAPIIKFELSRDDHFNQFLIWIEAVGQWAVGSILPEVKKAISLITEDFSEELALIQPVKTSQSNGKLNEQSLFSALQLSYKNVPWSLEKDDASAVSSSTASWGTPVINEAVFDKIKFPLYNVRPSLQVPVHRLDVPPQKHSRPTSVCSEPVNPRSVRFSEVPSKTPVAMTAISAVDAALPQWTEATRAVPEMAVKVPEVEGEVALEVNTELLLKRRLGHAMDEIKDLHKQLNHMKEEFSGSTMCLQDELLGLRKSMISVLRKERLNFKQGSTMRSNLLDAPNMIRSENSVSFEKEVSIVTTPTDPNARPDWPKPNKIAARQPSGLQNMLSLDTKVSTSITSSQSTTFAADGTSTDSQQKEDSSKSCKSPASITIFSPTIINYNAAEDAFERRDRDEKDADHQENYGALVRVPARGNNWSPVLTTHILCACMPSVLLRVIFFGFVMDYCMMSINANHAPSLSLYIARVLDNAIVV